MATRALASASFPFPIDDVWKHVRDFTFPGKLIKTTINSCEMEEGASPNAVGGIRVIKWKTGEERRDQLIELSDQYQRITWELIASVPEAEHSGSISTVQLYRISETNATLVQCSDAPKELIMFNQKAYLENLKEMRNTLTELLK